MLKKRIVTALGLILFFALPVWTEIPPDLYGRKLKKIEIPNQIGFSQRSIYLDSRGRVRIINIHYAFDDEWGNITQYFDLNGRVSRAFWEESSTLRVDKGYADFTNGILFRINSRSSEVDNKLQKGTVYPRVEELFRAIESSLNSQIDEYMYTLSLPDYQRADHYVDYFNYKTDRIAVPAAPFTVIYKKDATNSGVVCTLQPWEGVLLTNLYQAGEGEDEKDYCDLIPVSFYRKGKSLKGWVSLEHLRGYPEKYITWYTILTPHPGSIVSTSGFDVSLRKGPGTNYTRIQTLKFGTRLEILKESKTEDIPPWGSYPWYKVRLAAEDKKQQEGWVFGAFLEPVLEKIEK